jgi:hypothetical protein
VLDELLEVAADALVGGDAGQRRHPDGQRRVLLAPRREGRRVGLAVEEAPVNRPAGHAMEDGLQRRAEGLVVEHAAVDVGGGGGARDAGGFAQRGLDHRRGGAHVLGLEGGEGDREARGDAGDGGENGGLRLGRVRVGARHAELLASGAVLEVEDGAMLPVLDGRAEAVDVGARMAADVGAGDEDVHLARADPPRHRRAQPEQALAQPCLVVALAVEQRRCLGGADVADQVAEVAELAPQRGGVGELLARFETGAEQQTVDAARRGAGDHVDGRVRSEQIEQRPEDAAPAHQIVEAAGDAVLVDRQ